VDHARLGEIAAAVGAGRLIVALDSRGGRVVVRGWAEALEVSALDVLAELAPYCAGFLCTHVDGEGLMGGTDVAWFRDLARATRREITAAGGIATLEEVRCLLSIPVHVTLGMAIYTGRLRLDDLRGLAG
jgi:phosphoribosylformimino-5-aminoimidazole carboxamide ribonucleotide (ProFAR) isomerase